MGVLVMRDDGESSNKMGRDRSVDTRLRVCGSNRGVYKNVKERRRTFGHEDPGLAGEEARQGGILHQRLS